MWRGEGGTQRAILTQINAKIEVQSQSGDEIKSWGEWYNTFTFKTYFIWEFGDIYRQSPTFSPITKNLFLVTSMQI